MDDAINHLTKVTKFEKEDPTEFSFAPGWYAEVWFALSEIYHEQGDISESLKARRESQDRGISSKSDFMDYPESRD